MQVADFTLNVTHAYDLVCDASITAQHQHRPTNRLVIRDCVVSVVFVFRLHLSTSSFFMCRRALDHEQRTAFCVAIPDAWIIKRHICSKKSAIDFFQIDGVYEQCLLLNPCDFRKRASPCFFKVISDTFSSVLGFDMCIDFSAAVAPCMLIGFLCL